MTNKRIVFAIKIAIVVFASLFMGVGISMIYKSYVGSDPVGVFIQAVSLHTGISLGMIDILFNAAIVAIFVFITPKRIGASTLIQVIFVGVGVDLGGQLLSLIPDPTFWWGIAMNTAGALIMGLGVAIYLPCSVGTAPFDLLILFIKDVTKSSYRTGCYIVYAVFGIIGVIFGGVWGPGSVISTLLVGAFANWMLPRFEKLYAGWFPKPAQKDNKGEVYMKRIPVIMDVDTGVDDAVAIILALSSPKLEVMGITTTFGNRQLYRTHRNTLALMELLGRQDIPVAKGSDKPLVIPQPEYLDEGEYVVHGAEGLGGAVLPTPSIKEVSLPAEDFIADIVEKSPEKITLIPVGPLTNIAKFIEKYPHLLSKIQRISIMGGAAGEGNITPYAEVNIYFDPHAADVVFRSGIEIVMSGLNATRQAYVTKVEREKLISGEVTPLKQFAYDALKVYGAFCERHEFDGRYDEGDESEKVGNGAVLHDSLAVTCVADPDIVTLKKAFVRIETEGERIGQTVVDFDAPEDKANALVATGVDRDQFVANFFASFK